MRKQLQGITVVLFALLLMIGFGNAYFFDFSCRWSAVFAVLGFTGVIWTFLPDKKR